jgi:hypothetical protein
MSPQPAIQNCFDIGQKICKRNVETPSMKHLRSIRVRVGKILAEIVSFAKRTPDANLNTLLSAPAVKKISTEPENPRLGDTKANGRINIINENPPLHFANACRRLNLSDVEHKSNPISAPHRSASNPCKQHYYFGHRIRPRLRPLRKGFRRPSAGIKNPAGGLFYFQSRDRKEAVLI